jgi:hypothetical protein
VVAFDLNQAGHAAQQDILLYGTGVFATFAGALAVLGPLVVKPLNDRHQNAEGVLVPRPLGGMLEALNVDPRSDEARFLASTAPQAPGRQLAELSAIAEQLVSDGGNRINPDPFSWVAYMQALHAYLGANDAFWHEVVRSRDRGELRLVKPAPTGPFLPFFATKPKPPFIDVAGWQLNTKQNAPLRAIVAQLGLDWRRLGDPRYEHPLLDPSALEGALQLAPLAPEPELELAVALDVLAVESEPQSRVESGATFSLRGGGAVGEAVQYERPSSLVPLLLVAGLVLLLLVLA